MYRLRAPLKEFLDKRIVSNREIDEGFHHRILTSRTEPTYNKSQVSLALSQSLLEVGWVGGEPSLEKAIHVSQLKIIPSWVKTSLRTWYASSEISGVCGVVVVVGG